MKLFRSIKGKLIIFSLCISLIPIFIITVVYYLNARSTVKKQILTALTAIAESKKMHILSFMEAKKGRVIDFSSDGFIRDCVEKINSRGIQSNAFINLQRHLKKNKKPLDRHIAAITVVNPDGKVVSSTNEESIGKDMAKQEIFIKSLNNNYGETYVGQSHYSPYLNTNCIFISAPLKSRYHAEKIGIIINAYELEALNGITANRTGMGESGEVLLGKKKEEGIVFLTSFRYVNSLPLSLSIPVNTAEAKPMKLALEGNYGAIIAPDYRPVDVLAAYQYVSEIGWGLVAKIDKIEAFAPLRMLGMIALILGGACAVAAVSGGIAFSLSAAKPISKLKYANDRFAKGDMDYRVDISNRDEIGDLARSFNNMAGKLAHEIDEHKRAEIELTATNKELEAFCYSVSHDLRAPLRSVDGFSKALVEDFGDKLDSQGKDYVRRVRRASQRMGQLINDLLSLSRITRSELHHEKVDLSEIAQKIVTELQEKESKRQVEVVIPKGIVVDGDARLLLIVMENLLYNAWKFTGKQPHARIEFGAKQNENKTVYFVNDDGTGFDMAYANKLFGTFQRLHAPAEFEGTGIGLATVQRIIHRHGGRIWAKGAVGQGATFYFTV